MMYMKILINNQENKIIINKSKFIGFVKKVYTKEEIKIFLEEAKKEYHDATHICYAYILDNEKKCSDDKEPAGTAGKPILELLERNNLNYILAIVVRYFGGIKLGSNGLIKAYSTTIKNIITDNIKEEEIAYIIRINEEYQNSDKINYLLKDTIILKKEYHDKLIIEAIVKEKLLPTFKNISYEKIKKVIV